MGEKHWYRWSLFGAVAIAAIVAAGGYGVLQAVGEWQIVAERKAVAKWVNSLNSDAPGSPHNEVYFYESTLPGFRGMLGDRFAWCVYTDSPITPAERDRVVRAFPEAKQLIAVKGE